jgi:vancomycin resistance protein VanJ
MLSNTLTPRSLSLPQTLWRSFGNLLLGIAAAYCLIITMLLLIRALVGEGWMPMALLNAYLHLLLLPTVVIFPLSLLLRRWRLAVLAAPACFTIVLHYAPLFLPNTINVPPDAPTVTLLTYNIHAERAIFEPMVEVFRAADADIVALQEVTEEAAAYLDQELADLYPHRALHTFPNWYYGRGIFSRYPLTDDDAWPETAPVTVRLQRVEVDVDGVPLTLYNFHAPTSTPVWGGGYNFAPRRQQIADMLAMAAADGGAVALLGDFNTNDLDENYRRITTQFADAFREVGWGLGFTNPDWTWEQSREGLSFLPLHNRVDYVFHNADLQPLEALVWPTSGGSDHRPLRVRATISR